MEDVDTAGTEDETKDTVGRAALARDPRTAARSAAAAAAQAMLPYLRYAQPSRAALVDESNIQEAASDEGGAGAGSADGDIGPTQCLDGAASTVADGAAAEHGMALAVWDGAFAKAELALDRAPTRAEETQLLWLAEIEAVRISSAKIESSIPQTNITRCST